VRCPDCGNHAILAPENWRCTCGGAWEMVQSNSFDPGLIDQKITSIWRYSQLFSLDFDEPKFMMGAGWTPLLPLNLGGREIYVKPEYFSPTASFKDRGTELMINILAHQGVEHIAEDSSGNAGASVAAYAARAGMKAEIFVPAHASPAKQAQISIYGAHVNPIPGPRENAKLAAIGSIEKGIIYASHAYHPGFLLGQTSVAYEVWEQLGRRAPDWYVVPVGQGVHLLGVWLGFQRLFAAGLVDRIPHLVAVQAALLAPLCRAYEANLDNVPGVEPKLPSLAEGLAIARPVRGRRLLEAIRQSGGTCIMVEEDDISAARQQMANHGFYIEPTSATVVAALNKVFRLAKTEETIVVPLTGSGLKGSPVL
jgi:threonine synthase